MIIAPWNPVFLLILAIGAAFTALSIVFLRRASQKTKTVFLLSVCAANLILYIFYKVGMSLDTEYAQLAQKDIDMVYNLLPLHLCNINLFLIPIGVLTGNKAIKGFSFFVTPIAAFLALNFVEKEFTGYSLFKMRIFGYYMTHLILIVCAVLLVGLGFYKPDFKELPKVFAALFVISLSVHLVSTVLRTFVWSDCNYFYTYDPSGIGILETLWNLIGVPYLYLLPIALVLGLYMLLICAAAQAVTALKAKHRPSART